MAASLLCTVDMADWGAWAFAIAVLGVFAVVFLGLLYLGVRELIRLWPTLSLIAKLHAIVTVVLLFGALNFALGMGIVEVGIMGGTALNGKIEQNQYYLGEHGTYTEVSAKTYVLCLYYEKALLAIIFSSLVGAAVTYVAQRPPRHTIFNMLRDHTD